MTGFSFVDPPPWSRRSPARYDSPKKIRAVGWTFFVLFAGFGVPFIVGGSRMSLRQERLIRGAHPVSAVVIEAAVRDPMRLKRGTRYRPSVRHRYLLPDGVVRESDHVSPLDDHQRDARQIVAGYRPGQTVTTWVPAEEPHLAFLSRERSWEPWGSIGVGLLFGAFGLGCLTLLRRLARDDERRARESGLAATATRAA